MPKQRPIEEARLQFRMLTNQQLMVEIVLELNGISQALQELKRSFETNDN